MYFRKEELKMDFAQLIIISILVEAIWENLKMTYDNNKNICRFVILSMLALFWAIYVYKLYIHKNLQDKYSY